jgi:hypothetical protein
VVGKIKTEGFETKLPTGNKQNTNKQSPKILAQRERNDMSKRSSDEAIIALIATTSLAFSIIFLRPWKTYRSRITLISFF